MKILSNLKVNALTKLKASTLTKLKVNALNNLKSKGFTLAPLKVKGFTLAEVLITLTIIGVVAALTIPSLLANVSDKTYDAKRKGLATRMAQAIAQMDAINGYKDETDPEKNSAMKFIIEGLSKAYNITSVCEFDNFAACDFPSEFTRFLSDGRWYTKDYKKLSNLNANLTAAKLGGIDSEAAVFRTKNGESILLWYNPNCIAEQSPEDDGTKNSIREVCVQMIYDLDGGKKGPNTIGTDMGPLTVFYPDTPYVMAPTALIAWSSGTRTYESALNMCSGAAWRGYSKGELSLGSKEEFFSWGMISNISGGRDIYQWTSDTEGSNATDKAWMVNMTTLDSKLVTRDTLSGGDSCSSIK